MIVQVLGANDDLFTPFNYFAYPVLAAIPSAVLQRILNLGCTLLDPGFSVSAIDVKPRLFPRAQEIHIISKLLGNETPRKTSSPDVYPHIEK
jgi:hypothetical protein